MAETRNDLASTGLAGPKRKRNKKSPTKKNEDWAKVRGMIIELYPKESLKVVMEKIKKEYGFEAT